MAFTADAARAEQFRVGRNILFIMRMFAIRQTLALLPIFLLQFARCQEFSTLDIGVQGIGVMFSDPVGADAEQGGIGLRAVLNLSSRFSLDTEADYLLNKSQQDLQRGGQALMVLAGPRISWRKRNTALFVNARPGLVRFTNAGNVSFRTSPGIPLVIFGHEHRTHLALDFGAGLEVNTSTRTFVRFEFGQILLRYGDHTYRASNTTLSYLNPGTVGTGEIFAFGLGYRLGTVRETGLRDHGPTGDLGKWELGMQFGVLGMTRSSTTGPGVATYTPNYLADDQGVGTRIAYNLNRWLALDSALTYFYKQPSVGDSQRGGRMLEGTFGAKLGVRAKRIGMFVKMMPGFLSYGAVHDDLVPPYPTQRLTHFAVEGGGVVEYYPSRHAILRFDLGGLAVRYGATRVRAPRNALFPDGDFVQKGFTDIGMQFSTGFGWRF